MLTNKAKYGLKAVLHLADLQPDNSASGADIAGVNRIPKRFLDAILIELRNAGIVQAKKGPRGGYRLAQPAKEIRVGHVVRTLDGALAPIACVSKSAYLPCHDCEDMETCALRITMGKVRDAISDILDRMTIEEMLRLRHERHPDLMYYI